MTLRAFFSNMKRRLVRQVLGAISQFEKASAVAKLAAARKRKRERDGRCEGRKPLSETKPSCCPLAQAPSASAQGWATALREVSKESRSPSTVLKTHVSRA